MVCGKKELHRAGGSDVDKGGENFGRKPRPQLESRDLGLLLVT